MAEKRQRVKFPWDLYWENKTYKLKWSISLEFCLFIERFHSRVQHLCKFIGTKESVYIRKEFNSHRIGLVHQYGHRDVMWKRSIHDSIIVENDFKSNYLEYSTVDKEGSEKLLARKSFFLENTLLGRSCSSKNDADSITARQTGTICPIQGQLMTLQMAL